MSLLCLSVNVPGLRLSPDVRGLFVRSSRHVVFPVRLAGGQHRPSGAGHAVGQRDRGHVSVTSLKQSPEPLIAPIRLGLALPLAHHRPGAMDQQITHVAVAALGRGRATDPCPRSNTAAAPAPAKPRIPDHCGTSPDPLSWTTAPWPSSARHRESSSVIGPVHPQRRFVQSGRRTAPPAVPCEPAPHTARPAPRETVVTTSLGRCPPLPRSSATAGAT